MYTGFSAITDSPQGTPLHIVPLLIVLPSTSFSARRKMSAGFSRKSCVWSATARGVARFPGQLGLSPSGPATVVMLAIVKTDAEPALS